MYTLFVIVFYVSQAVTSSTIDGFGTKSLCDTAGQEIVRSADTMITQVKYSCVFKG